MSTLFETSIDVYK